MNARSEIDQVRQALAMHDAGYKWSVHCEHVATLLQEYDRLKSEIVSLERERLMRRTRPRLY
jgi:hypothetical protein